jgi:hypothetical protein
MGKPPEKKPTPSPPPPPHALPMELQVGDRLVDETGEWGVIGRRPAGTTPASAFRGWASPAALRFRIWRAHERVAVRRG